MFSSKIYMLALFLFVMGYSNAQSKLVINGAIINVTNGGSLVVNDSGSDAISRTSGHIISEGENNKVIWSIETTVGAYVIPFGYGATDYIPVSFTKTAGVGSGSFEFSSYRTTNWLNSSDLPSVVNHLNNSTGTDNSGFVVDRFWQLNAVNYTTKPSLSNVTFTYLDIEHSAGSNSIIESNLKAQRWNDASSSWGDFAPSGIVNTTLNTVFVANIPSTDLYEWWTLVDLSIPLPVEFADFNAVCNNGSVLLEWSTASEINNDYFSVERSVDGENWEAIDVVDGAGTNSQTSYYSAIDEYPLSDCYYRIRQTDFDGKMNYTETIAISCEKQESFSISVYPNPSNGVFTLSTSFSKNNGSSMFEIIDMQGKIIRKGLISSSVLKIDLSSSSKGVYLLKASSGNDDVMEIRKLVVQ